MPVVPPLATPSSTADAFVGTSGWAYPSWKPKFYPAALRGKDFLTFYSSQLTSVEVNYTFRKLATEKQLQAWLDATPPGFRFTFKAPQRITHFQRLLDCEEAVAEFVQSLAPVRKCGRLGALLFQLPPNFKADPERLSAFLKLRSLRGKAAPKLAFEFRHTSWFTDETYAVLRRYDAALCVADSDDLVTPDVQTAAHRYYRLRSPGGYSARTLRAFAERMAPAIPNSDTYIYLKHEDEPTGPLQARALLRRLNELQGGRA
jgi:uncharacterized protein YecE (DUF72 family)